MRLPAALTVSIVVATLAGTLADVGTVANAAGSSPVDYGATWTVDTGANSLAEFAPHASGAATPIATIHGAATGLSAPVAVVVSSTGVLYVANSGNNSITQYPNGATGNTPPSATIKGSATGLNAPSSISLAGGELWVTNPSTNVVEAFTAGSSGNELPAETIAGTKTRLNHPVGVAVDPSLSASDEDSDDLGPAPQIYVINAPTAATGNITAYSTDKLGDVAPDVTIPSATKHPLHSPTAILLEGSDDIWVADGATDTLSELLVFPPEAGDPPGLTSSKPITTIAGSSTGIDTPSGLGFNALGDLVEANAGDHSVRVFGANAHGNAHPISTLTGLGSTAGSPAAAAVLGTHPGAPTNFKVVVHRTPKTASATLTWKAPAVTGGGIIGYGVLALDITSLIKALGAIGLGAARTDAEHQMARHQAAHAAHPSLQGTKFTKKLKLGHSYIFDVVAVNAFGASGLSHPVFRTIAIAATAPQDVKASSSHHSISVHWSAPKNDGGDPVKAYRIEYGTCVPGSKGCKSHALIVPAKRRFATIRKLKPGTTYDVRIAAKTKHGLGALSPTAKAVPLA
jgi:hypothetical protein